MENNDKPLSEARQKNPKIPANGQFTSEYQPDPSTKGAKSKWDYDGDEFYEEIFQHAFQGMIDSEIAYALSEPLNPNTFIKMKNGTYEGWNEEENARRGARISRMLERARLKTNSIVRGRYLKAALGGIKTKNVTTTRRRLKIQGQLTDDEEIQTTTAEYESAPNIQALATWLHHHDPEWRKYEGRVEADYADDPDAIPEAKKGIDIAAWIDMEVKDKEALAKLEAEENTEEDPGL